MRGYLNLANGDHFTGKLITASPTKDIEGEVVFFTGMTGYQEVLTDPSYKNQIIVFTYPLIGNYGINEEDFESKKPHVAGVITYQATDSYNHYEAKYSLKQYLQKWNIPLLTHVDTRALVKKIRNEGTMLAKISSKLIQDYVPAQADEKPVNDVSEKTIVTYGSGELHMVLIDFGCKKSIVDSLLKRDCKVTVVPYDTPYETIASYNPTGVILSNGPGDPKQLSHLLPSIKKTIEHYPTLAICLGHQLVALAFGADTKKLTFGHRGANQPVYDKKENKVYITSQNHSYVVNEESLDHTNLAVRFINVNDGSIEGISHTSLPILSVQFHPEAHPGPEDSSWIFDEYLSSIVEVRREKTYA